MSDLVRTELDDGILTITMTRAEKRNALNPELCAALDAAFSEASADGVRGVLLLAEGPVFCAGLDVASLMALAGGDGQLVDGPALQDTFMALERSGRPSVCAVQGVAVGAGLQLALACDLRVAAEDLRVGLFEIHYGIIPDLGGIHRVTRLCGPARAKDIVLTGREVGAEEALRIGLVDRVVPLTELHDAARALLRDICSKAPGAVAAARRMIEAAAHGQGDDENLKAVMEAQRECIQSPDFSEAVSARIQKRPAVFSSNS